MSFDHLKDKARHNAEDKLLAKLHVKCKECDTRMDTGRQEGKRYYHCGNALFHEDGLARYVYVEMPKYLDLEGEINTKLSSEKETN